MHAKRVYPVGVRESEAPMTEKFYVYRQDYTGRGVQFSTESYGSAERASINALGFRELERVQRRNRTTPEGRCPAVYYVVVQNAVGHRRAAEVTQA